MLFQNGGLGNQFFQYYSANLFAPKALIITIGFHDLYKCIIPPHLSITKEVQYKLINGISARLGIKKIRYFAKHKFLIGYINEISQANRLIYNTASNPLTGLVLQEGFFQDSSMFSSFSIANYPLRSSLRQKARKWLDINIKSRNLNPYFLHIRRGDYVRWPTESHPATLPCQWFNRQVRHIISTDPRAHFIVFSDDIPYAREFFGLRSKFTVYQSSLADEFALMSECESGGILSASTLAWWAAFYGRHTFPNAKYIAPKYWAGWPKRQWYPSAIKTPWLNYEAVI